MNGLEPQDAAPGPDDQTKGLLDVEVFESITHPGKLLVLSDWTDETAARAWAPATPSGGARPRHRHVRVIRVYGVFKRLEAPQFFPSAMTA